MSSKRRLAAILFADIAGYTAMMQHDENDGLRRVYRFRKVMDEEVNTHGGEILQYYGDGGLVIFASAVDAVSCACQVQRTLNRKDSEQEDRLYVPVRIGIHVGDIVADGEDVFGDGVNLASRVEVLATPGSILITERVAHDIQSHPEFEVVALGDFLLKNVTHPIKVYAVKGEGIPVPGRRAMREQLRLNGGKETGIKAKRLKTLGFALGLLALLALTFQFWPSGEDAGGTRLNGDRLSRGKSIAVLPFKDLSPEGDQAYFSSGIAEEVLTTLAQLPELKVTGRVSSFSFEDKSMEIPEMGKELGVSTVLGGSVRKAGDRLRIVAQLYETEKGYVLWSERYERKMDDIFAIQDEIAQAVAEKLQIYLSDRDLSLRTSRNTSSREAYEWYLRGKYMLSQRVDGAEKARAFFERSLEKDPRFSLAHAGLANAYIWLAWGNYLSSHEAFPKAREHARKALEYDDSLAYAHAILGTIHLWYDWDWPAAREALQTAVSINPSEGPAHLDLGWLNLISGDFDGAFADARQARDLDPLNLEYNIDLADFQRIAGDYDGSLEAGRSMRQLYPDNSDPLWIIGMAHYHLGDFSPAEEAFREAAGLSEEPTLYLIHRGMALAKMNRTETARQILEQLQTEEPAEEVAPVELAMLYLTLGDRDEALDLLEKSYDMHANWLISIAVDPVWDEIRGEPRFQALIDKMAFPE